MAGSWIADRFPEFEAPIQRLVDQHLELEHEPLHLALTYLPAKRDQRHIYLFEVVGSHWGAGGFEPDPDQDLLEATYGSTNGFPMLQDEKLHLVLTNPRELGVALERGWALAIEVVAAIHDGDYKILHADELGKQALAKLQSAGRRLEPVRG